MAETALNRETVLSKEVKQCCYSPEQGQKMDRAIAVPFHDLGARKGCVVSITPWPLYPWERPGTHCTGGWVGPRASLDVCEKSRFDPRTVQPIATCYTD
jgi:hypothetical protein